MSDWRGRDADQEDLQKRMLLAAAREKPAGDRRVFQKGTPLDTINKAIAFAARSKELIERHARVKEQARRLLARPDFDERLAYMNANLLHGAEPTSREELERYANGALDMEALRLDSTVVQLEEDIAAVQAALASAVLTPIPRRNGSLDYHMLVDEANDEKTGVVFETVRYAETRETAEGKAWVRRVLKVIPHTETFIWSPDILKIVQATARRIPTDFRLFPERFVTQHPQWWWWGRTTAAELQLTYTQKRNRGVTHLIVGMLVCPQATAGLDDEEDLPASIIHPIVVLNAKNNIVGSPVIWQHAKDAGTIQELYPDVDYPNAWWSCSFLAAALSWISQKIVITSQHPVGRGARKRAEAKQVLHTTKVIQLRRTERETPKPVGDAKHVEWSHRWMVEEFYRNQWYPTRQAHERILITSFVKGPADKPLVLKDKVYVVNR